MPLPPALCLITPLTGHPQCPRNARSSLFTFSLKTEGKKDEELEKQRSQVVSREVPLGEARQGAGRGLWGQGPSDLRGGRPHSCADRHPPDPHPLNTISPNLGSKSADAQRGCMQCPCWSLSQICSGRREWKRKLKK